MDAVGLDDVANERSHCKTTQYAHKLVLCTRVQSLQLCPHQCDCRQFNLTAGPILGASKSLAPYTLIGRPCCYYSRAYATAASCKSGAEQQRTRNAAVLDLGVAQEADVGSLAVAELIVVGQADGIPEAISNALRCEGEGGAGGQGGCCSFQVRQRQKSALRAGRD